MGRVRDDSRKRELGGFHGVRNCVGGLAFAILIQHDSTWFFRKDTLDILGSRLMCHPQIAWLPQLRSPFLECNMSESATSRSVASVSRYQLRGVATVKTVVEGEVHPLVLA